MVAISKAISSEPIEDHNDPGEFSATLFLVMTVVVRMLMRKRPWNVLVSIAAVSLASQTLTKLLCFVSNFYVLVLVDVSSAYKNTGT